MTYGSARRESIGPPHVIKKDEAAAAVIGAEPNGLSTTIVLASAGLEVEVREAADEIGGGARSEGPTLPGFVHDLDAVP